MLLLRLCHEAMSHKLLILSFPISHLQVVHSAHLWNRRWRPWAAPCRCWMWRDWMSKPKRTRPRRSSSAPRARPQTDRGRDGQVTGTNLEEPMPSVSLPVRTIREWSPTEAERHIPLTVIVKVSIKSQVAVTLLLPLLRFCQRGRAAVPSKVLLWEDGGRERLVPPRWSPTAHVRSENLPRDRIWPAGEVTAKH